MKMLFTFCVLAFVTIHGIDATIVQQYLVGLTDRQIIEYLVTSVSHLDDDRVKQQQRIEALEFIIHDQSKVINDLQKTLREINLSTDTLPGTTDDLVDIHEQAAEQTIKQPSQPSKSGGKRSVRSVKGRLRQLAGSPVAFSAVALTNEPHLGAHQNLVFESTNVNTNSVYNTHHGVFTAPVPGVYVITATVLAYNNREVWCDITVNGNVKAHVYARGTDGRHDQGSNTILLHLTKGDDVSVQNLAVDDAVWGNRYTTFSGFLLYGEEPSSIIG